MNDLISRKALIKNLEEYKKEAVTVREQLFFDGIMAIVDNQPTAFDVDEVVKQIEEIMKDDEIRFANQVVSRATNIVKGAVKNE